VKPHDSVSFLEHPVYIHGWPWSWNTLRCLGSCGQWKFAECCESDHRKITAAVKCSRPSADQTVAWPCTVFTVSYTLASWPSQVYCWDFHTMRLRFAYRLTHGVFLICLIIVRWLRVPGLVRVLSVTCVHIGQVMSVVPIVPFLSFASNSMNCVTVCDLNTQRPLL